MRTRSWRRYKKEIKIIKRLKNSASIQHWYHMSDANKNTIRHYLWVDLIGTDYHYMFKTMTSTQSGRYRYGKKGRKMRGYYGSDIKNRVYDKKMFKKMIEQDYGIKHFNISYGFMESNTAE